MMRYKPNIMGEFFVCVVGSSQPLTMSFRFRMASLIPFLICRPLVAM